MKDIGKSLRKACKPELEWSRRSAGVARRTKLYLAGAMRGLPNLNAPAFRRYAQQLRDEGYHVFNPVEATEDTYGDGIFEDPESLALVDDRLMFSIDLDWLCNEAEVIALIPGWETSLGANAERATALALGLKVVELASLPHSARPFGPTP